MVNLKSGKWMWKARHGQPWPGRWTWDDPSHSRRQWSCVGKLGESWGQTVTPAKAVTLSTPSQPLLGLRDEGRAVPPTLEPQPSLWVLWGGCAVWSRTPTVWNAQKLPGS